jgi:hypothetical protein
VRDREIGEVVGGVQTGCEAVSILDDDDVAVGFDLAERAIDNREVRRCKAVGLRGVEWRERRSIAERRDDLEREISGRGSDQSGSVISHRQAVANNASGSGGFHHADAERTHLERKGERASNRGAAGARTGSADDEAMRHRQPVSMNRAVR